MCTDAVDGEWGLSNSLLLPFLVVRVFAVKILTFPTTLEDGAKVVIKNEAFQGDEFTICIDFYTLLDTSRHFIKSVDDQDLIFEVEEYGALIYIKLAGIWYMAEPSWSVDTATWERLCVS